MKVFEKFASYNYEYPEDMKMILQYLSEHGKVNVSDKRIELLYYDFSDKMYCAGWISVSDQRLEEFADYLSTIEIIET